MATATKIDLETGEVLTPITLRALGEEYNTLYRIMEEMGDEEAITLESGYTPEEVAAYERSVIDRENAMVEWLTANERGQYAKIDSYIEVLDFFGARMERRKAEAARVAVLAKQDAARIDGLRARLIEHMRTTEQKIIETDLHKIQLVNNGGKLAMRLDERYVEEPETLPEPYRKVVIGPDMTAIRADLDKGDDLRMFSPNPNIDLLPEEFSDGVQGVDWFAVENALRSGDDTRRLIIDNQSDIPDCYIDWSDGGPIIDVAAIESALRDGETVPGARLTKALGKLRDPIAVLLPRGQHLKIS